MPRRRFEASLTAVATISSENGSPSSKATRTLRYSISSTPSGSGVTTLTVSVSGRLLVAAVEDVDDDPEHHPADADGERRGLSAITTIQAAKVPRPPRTAVSGTRTPKARKLSGGFQGRSSSDFSPPQLDHRDVGDREREHRAERVHRRQEVGLARDQGDHRDRREDEDRDVGRAVAGVDLAQALRQLAVLAHRVGEAGDADQAGVGRDQQDHRGEDADVVAQRFGEAGAEAEVLDDAEDRVVGELRARARSCSGRRRSG